jgi:hypothetical protein
MNDKQIEFAVAVHNLGEGTGTSENKCGKNSGNNSKKIGQCGEHF